jgi:hypothetical protein
MAEASAVAASIMFVMGIAPPAIGVVSIKPRYLRLNCENHDFTFQFQKTTGF